MSTPDSDLIELFEDGKLPTGANFRELILSKVNIEEFDRHVEQFEAWKERNEVQIGPDGAGWDLLQDGPSTLNLTPNKGNEVESAHAFVDLYGWTASYGVIGKVDGTDAFVAPKPDLKLDKLQSVASDGRWKVLMDMPGRVVAFQVTAATAQPAAIEDPGLGSLLRWLVGYVPPANAILHATATATGPNMPPQLSNLSTTTAADVLREFIIFLLGLAVLALIFGVTLDTEVRISFTNGFDPEQMGTYIEGLISKLRDLWGLIAEMPSIGKVVAVIAVLYIARRIFELITARRNGLRLRWKKTSGSVFKGNRAWRLEVKGPKLGEAGDARLYYHITALWG